MESSSDAESSTEEEKSHGSVIDMEDLGNVMNRMKKAKVKTKPASVHFVYSQFVLYHRPFSRALKE